MATVGDVSSSAGAQVVDQPEPPPPPPPPPPVEGSKAPEGIAGGLTKTFGDQELNNDFLELLNNPAVDKLSPGDKDQVLTDAAQIFGTFKAAIDASGADGSGALDDGRIDASELAELRQILAAPVTSAEGGDSKTYADSIVALHDKIGSTIGNENIPQSIEDIYNLVTAAPSDLAAVPTSNSKPADNLEKVLKELDAAQADGKVTPEEYQRLVGSDAFQGLPEWIQKVVSNLAGGPAGEDAGSPPVTGDEGGAPITDSTTGATGEVPNTGETSGSSEENGSPGQDGGAGATGEANDTAPVDTGSTLATSDLMRLLMTLLGLLSDGQITPEELEALKNDPAFQKLPQEMQDLILSNPGGVAEALSAGAQASGVLDDQELSPEEVQTLLTNTIEGVENGSIPLQDNSGVVQLLNGLLGNSQSPGAPVEETSEVSRTQ